MLFIIQIRKTFHSVSGILMTVRSGASCMIFNTILTQSVALVPQMDCCSMRTKCDIITTYDNVVRTIQYVKKSA